jgi:predicted Zn finger-like uncharacterized protein
MLLPCPHCRRRFNLHAEQVHAERAKIRCPGCGGVFRVDFGSPKGRANQKREMTAGFAVSGNGLPANAPADAHTFLGKHTATARHLLRRERPRFFAFWTLVPACCLLLALTGILLSGPWVDTTVPDFNASQDEGRATARFSSSVSYRPEASQQGTPSFQGSATGTAEVDPQPGALVARAYWTSPSSRRPLCEALRVPQSELLQGEDQDLCQIYPLWIEYLVLETGPVPNCDPESAFSLASNSLQLESLCGPGHAFLSAYYLRKGLLERSQSFLDQALGQTPDDPWVRLVEALVYERAYFDDGKAIPILEDLCRERPTFSVAQYLLGRAYIRGEAYRQANSVFESLKEEAKGQVAFWRIRRALTSLEQAPHQSVEQAESLLALSRSFTTLEDDPMAQDLYCRVLEEMQTRLPEGERSSAYCELAKIYERRGDPSSAYEAYRSALEIDPGCPAARQGIRDLLPSHDGNS